MDRLFITEKFTVKLRGVRMMRKHWNPMIGAAIALSLGVLPTAAGAAPSREDAAALRNVRERQSDASMLQNEARNRARAEAQRAAAATGQIAVEETERPKLDLPDTLKVQVNGFKITGQDVIPEPELQALLADKKGQLLTFKDLQEGADILTRYFRGKGYLVAHAYLPVQKINDGIVEYTVTVGTLDGFTINNHTSIHQGALERETNFLKKEKYLTRDNLERAVWLLTDLAGADAKATLQKGSQPGSVHVVLDVDAYKGKQGLFTASNYGSRSMGYNQYSVNYDFLNLAHEGDHLTANLSTSGRKMFDWGLNYTLPVIRDGWRLSAGYNVLSYDLGDEFAQYDGVGHSKVASLGLDYAIRRSRKHNLYAGIRYEHSDIKDEYRKIWNSTYGDKTGDAGVLALYGDDEDPLGATDWRVEYKWGNITNDAFYSDDIYTRWLAGSDRTNGTYHKATGYIQRRQNMNDRTYLLLTARGQYAFSNLDSSEHFYLGGPYGLRAYPTSEGSGDTGYLTRAELRWLLPLKKQDQQLYLAFYLEHGGVWINKDSSLTPAGEKNHRNLQDVGIGLIWSRYQDWFVRADYAWRLGAEEPVSDTSHKNGHFWLIGGVYF